MRNVFEARCNNHYGCNTEYPEPLRARLAQERARITYPKSVHSWPKAVHSCATLLHLLTSCPSRPLRPSRDPFAWTASGVSAWKAWKSFSFSCSRLHRVASLRVSAAASVSLLPRP